MRDSRITYLSVLLLVFAGQLCEGADVVCSPVYSVEYCDIENFPTLSQDESVNIIHPNPQGVTHLIMHSSRNMTKLPKTVFLTFPNVERVRIISTNVSRINRGELQNARNVNEFLLYQNQIEDIEDFSFTGLDNTTILDLSDNKLRVIRRNTFEGLVNLAELNLDINQIDSIEDGAFNFLHLLQLDLRRNKLTTISRHTLVGARPMRIFFIANNGLTKIGDFFDGMTELEGIDLSDNPVADLNFTMFAKMPKLKIVNIARSAFKTATDEDVATAESAGSNLEEVALHEDQLSHDFLVAIHRIFKRLRALHIGGRGPQENFREEEILKVIPDITITTFKMRSD